MVGSLFLITGNRETGIWTCCRCCHIPEQKAPGKVSVHRDKEKKSKHFFLVEFWKSVNISIWLAEALSIK